MEGNPEDIPYVAVHLPTTLRSSLIRNPPPPPRKNYERQRMRFLGGALCYSAKSRSIDGSIHQRSAAYGHKVTVPPQENGGCSIYTKPRCHWQKGSRGGVMTSIHRVQHAWTWHGGGRIHFIAPRKRGEVIYCQATMLLHILKWRSTASNSFISFTHPCKYVF